MRGKVYLSANCNKIVRIIPAHAGKSFRHELWKILIWDHPRSCGEKLPYKKRKKIEQGSSPLMRGKVNEGDFLEAEFGIIPAHAGKSGTAESRTSPAKDHPRSCGEKPGVLAGLLR